MDKYYKNDSPNTFRVSKNQILRLINKKNEQVYIPVPLGLNLDSFDVLSEANDHILLSSSEKLNSDFFKDIKLPKNPKILEFDGFKMSLIYDIIDYQKALQLLHQEHYILNLPIGLPVILKKNEEIIGVIYFSKLTHGNPDGRINYLKEKENIKSNEEIRKFANHHIGCIDRIVIDSSKQGQGAGKVFVKNLGEFLKEVFPNKNLKAIEVMTSWSLSEFINKGKSESLITDINDINFNESEDFFCKAHYERISQTNSEAKKPKKERKDKGRVDRLDRKKVNKKGVIIHKPEKVIRYYYIKTVKYE